MAKTKKQRQNEFKKHLLYDQNVLFMNILFTTLLRLLNIIQFELEFKISFSEKNILDSSGECCHKRKLWMQMEIASSNILVGSAGTSN